MQLPILRNPLILAPAPCLKHSYRDHISVLLKIIYSRHALEKLKILKEHGVDIVEQFISDALLYPDRVVPGLSGRLVAQKVLDEGHVLRVVYVKEENQIRVVTLYPARRERY